MAADNLLVTVDRKLEERNGSILYDLINYQLPSGNSPVNAFILHDVEQFLLGVACPNIYVLNPNWTGILGPTGNPPLAGGNYQNQITSGEWSHHTIITNDSLASTPIKIYRGAPYPTTLTTPPTTFNFMAVTAGLPALTSQQNINSAILLNDCIVLANQLRANMLSHMQDAGSPGVINTNLHLALDTADIALLTGSTPATSQTTLFTLIPILVQAYGPHVTDVLGTGNPVFHFTAALQTYPLNYQLNNSTTTATSVTTITQAATMLDDLKTKFTLHQLACFTHDQYNNYGIIGRYLTSSPHIGSIVTTPLLSPSYTQSFLLINTFKAVFNAHIADTMEHRAADTNDIISVPDATDLDSFYVLAAHSACQYEDHFDDSDAGNYNINVATITSGSAVLTGTTFADGHRAGQDTFTVGGTPTIWDALGSVFPTQPVTVVSSGVGHMTASVTAGSTQSAYPLTIVYSLYHVGEQNDTLAEDIFQILNDFNGYQPDAANISNWIPLISQTIAAYNAHDANTAVHIVADLHQDTDTTAPTFAQYAYAFHYFYQYMRYDGVIFNVVGPPTFVGPVVTETISPSYTSPNPSGGSALTYPTTDLVITNIPPLVNGGQNNYDTANVQIKIFRTINAGSTYYQDGIIPNGTVSFTDTLPDTSNISLPNVIPLQQQPTIYTSGGVVNFDPAPVCKYVAVLNNTAYYGAILDTGQTFLNRIRQSIQNNIDSSPGSFFLDLADNLMGISSTRNNLVAFCSHSTYQVQGVFNQLGQGQMSAQSISDTIGCVSAESIVRTDVGIFFAGTDGFYYTDGFQLIKLSSELNLTYAALTNNSNQKRAISGCYDRYNRRVWWTTQPDPSDYSATQSWIFHVNYGVTANGVFTSASNFENYRPSCMIFWNGNQIRGDARGYIFLHTPLVMTDPVVNIKTSPLTWNTAYIPYNYSSCAVDFGTTFNRKWLTRMSLQGKNIGNIGAQILSWSDNGRVAPLYLAPMWSNTNIMWGKPNIIWSASNSSQPITWDQVPEIDFWRRFPATQLRADYKQVQILPAKIGVYRYQDWPVGSAAFITPQGNGTATARILTPPGYSSITWPLDVIGYVFASQSDGYVAEYLITGLIKTIVSNDTLVLSDPSNSLPQMQVAWVIRGILKQQKLSMTSYNIHFTLLGKMQRAYQGSQDAGENAAGTSYSDSHLVTEAGDTLTTEGGDEFIP